jgi:hypothetical protein
MKNLFNDISQGEKDRILEMHKPKKVFIEENQKQIKELPPISLKKLQNFNPTNNTVITNKNILNKLRTIPEMGQLNLDVNDNGFLSKVSQILTNKGITPYLNVNTDQFGNAQSVNPGISFSVPKLGIDLNLESGYFGISKELPFLNNSTLTASFTPEPDESTGYKDNVNRGSSYQLNSKYNVGLKIPIGK